MAHFMVSKLSIILISIQKKRFKPNAHTGSVSGDLKRVCETDLGLISQCCLAKQVLKMNKQILANLSLKINVKVGVQTIPLLVVFCALLRLLSLTQPFVFKGWGKEHCTG
jgi:hypothetical protein